MPVEVNNNDEELKFSEFFQNGYRGDEPEQINTLCHQLCKDYLGGVWHNIPEESIIIKRITGGFCNQLYYCGVLSDIKHLSDEPTEVAIRLYGKKNQMQEQIQHENERLNDTIIGTIVSENKLGPKIYGLFANGEIIKYYKCHQFQVEHQKQPEVVRELAQKLAKFHSLKVPIKKSKSLADIMRMSYAKACELYTIPMLCDQYKCVTLKTVNLNQEIDWLDSLVKRANSPIVFSHFDFRGSNILVIDDSDGIERETQSRIVLCDYEYAGYYNRGVDLSAILFEWGHSIDELFDTTEFPEPSIITPFIDAYIEQSGEIYGDQYRKDSVNSREHIIFEVNVFILLRCVFFAAMLMRMDEESTQRSIFSTKKQQLSLAEATIKTYLQLKNKFQFEMF